MSDVRNYHGQPVLKEPVWSWEIPCYFFTGGLAGASAGFAYAAHLRGERAVARRAWTSALAGILVSPPLLISDLGKPARFVNMLRMFKVTSPMSVGSWILTVSGGSTVLAAGHAWGGWFRRLAAVARPVAALFGLPLSTYTAALIANTAVPAWHEARRELPVVFAAGAGLSAGAASLIVAPLDEAAMARRLALGGAIAELGSTIVMQRRLGELGHAYHHGRARGFDLLARGLIAGSAALLLARGKRSRPAAAGAGACLLAGALSTRWSIFVAGSQSAADPAAVIGPQRERIRGGETNGRRASVGSGVGPG